MSKKILIVEDNRELAQLLEGHLRDLAFQVDVAFDGKAGLAKAESDNYDLVILDLMLPGLDGIEVCRRLRRKPSYIPILMLTAKSSEMDRVVGLEIGADDYVSKPFSVRELLARVKAILRRVDELTDVTKAVMLAVIRAGELVIDPSKRSVLLEGQPVNLTAKEFDLLLHFARKPGKVYSRSHLLDSVWGYGHDGYEHTVNSHINRLRAKIEKDPAHPVYLLNPVGEILAYSAPRGKVKLQKVDLEPLKKWYQGDAVLPLTGDDPRNPDRRKVFTVARIPEQGQLQGHLYIILGGEIFDNIVQKLKGSYIMQISFWWIVASLLFALVTGLLLFAYLTRRLTKLAAVMDSFDLSQIATQLQTILEKDQQPVDEIDRLTSVNWLMTWCKSLIYRPRRSKLKFRSTLIKAFRLCTPILQ